VPMHHFRKNLALCLAMLFVAFTARGESAENEPGTISADNINRSDAQENTIGYSRVTKIFPALFEGSTQVLVELTGAITYKSATLAGDPSRGLPERLYADLAGARLARGIAGSMPLDDPCIQQIRVAQFDAGVVRIVLDMKSPCESKVALLSDPTRLVIDVRSKTAPREQPPVVKAKASPRGRPAEASVVKARKIVLDPGHGGKDTGAIGHGGLMEKDVVLVIARKLARRLTKELGVEVTLTRGDDSFIALEDRTAIANRENADLFISLHANASPNPQVRGVETYYLNNTDDEAAKRLAARENSTSTQSVSDIQFILSDLIQNSKLEDSISLAHHLHTSLVSHTGQRLGDVKDLGVKQALFFVLVGAKMPSVLAEIFFITNRHDATWLGRDAYQDNIVEGLLQGIKEYYRKNLAGRNNL
jgi:N-acetylmuramoyl-L-alanine amidase